MRDVNYSIFMTQLTKLHAFPESLGIFVVNSLKQITQEIENAEENNITIYADEGSLSAPYYNFYYDNNGKKVKIDFLSLP